MTRERTGRKETGWCAVAEMREYEERMRIMGLNDPK